MSNKPSENINFSINYPKLNDEDDIYTHHSTCTNEEDENSEHNDHKDHVDIKHKKKDLLKKSNLLFLNNGWNENNEKIVITIGEHAASYKWMHEKNATIDKRLNDIISLSLILLSTVLSADTILNYSEGTTNEVVTILIKIFIYIINILSVLQQFLKLQESSNVHMEYANSFIHLYHDIQQQMSTYRIHRLNASRYISDCIKKYDTLVIKGPRINSFIVNEFKKKFNTSEISLPDIVDKIQKIEIVSEPPTVLKTKHVQNKSIHINDNQSSKETTHLRTMNNIFKIDGDFSESDVNDLNPIELRRLKRKFLKAKSDFEYKRFLEHNLDF